MDNPLNMLATIAGKAQDVDDALPSNSSYNYYKGRNLSGFGNTGYMYTYERKCTIPGIM